MFLFSSISVDTNRSYLHSYGGLVVACDRGSQGGCGTSRLQHTSNDQVHRGGNGIRANLVYLPSTSGAFLAREEGGRMGRGQSNKFSPNCNEKVGNSRISLCSVLITPTVHFSVEDSKSFPLHYNRSVDVDTVTLLLPQRENFDTSPGMNYR